MKADVLLTKEEAAALGGLRLAFIGDAVHTLFVKEKLVLTDKNKVGILHTLATEKVSANAQRSCIEKVFEILTDDEKDIYRRGRNAHVQHIPKNQTESDYHSATGLEALLGYLYLTGQTDRINYILDIQKEN